ncbi:MAG: DUF6090 family protein [Balneolaceae bacterium]|nr:DUF6090 family protein [Balneolaceae bacterium]
MITLFRRIRQKLIDSGSATKYLLYAFGEILLVVIGILIALQINNWNEERKLRLEERELLTNLSVSFTNKLAELEEKNEDRLTNIATINNLLIDISNGNSRISLGDELYTIIGQLYTWYTVNEEFSVIDMLFSSGKINTISNDSLKAKLIVWPDQMEEMFEEQRVIQDLVVHQLNPIIGRYIPYSTVSNNFFPEYAPDSGYTDSPNKYDISGLLEDREFENQIAHKKIYLVNNIQDTNILIQNAETILALIKEDLARD